MSDCSVAAVAAVLDLLLAGETGDPALCQADGNVDLIATQGSDHVSGTGGEGDKADLEWEACSDCL